MKNTYYYRVEIFLTAFDKSKPTLDLTEDFYGADLLESRERAIRYCNEQQESILSKGTFHDKPILGYSEGRNAADQSAFSLVLYLVENQGDDFDMEYPIAGESDQEMEEGRQLEKKVFADMNIIFIEV